MGGNSRRNGKYPSPFTNLETVQTSEDWCVDDKWSYHGSTSNRNTVTTPPFVSVPDPQLPSMMCLATPTRSLATRWRAERSWVPPRSGTTSTWSRDDMSFVTWWYVVCHVICLLSRVMFLIFFLTWNDREFYSQYTFWGRPFLAFALMGWQSLWSKRENWFEMNKLMRLSNRINLLTKGPIFV